jgi:hypothetical protein
MLSTAFLLAASMVLGQAEGKTDAQPEYNPHLSPIAWKIGEWECKQLSATGELRTMYKNTIKWVANNQVIQIEISETKADGTAGSSGVVLIHWDGSINKVREYGCWSGNTFMEGTLTELSETGHLWEERLVYGNGNQGHFRHKVSYDPEADTLTRGWSKTSGSGSHDMGPYVFHRVKNQ